MPSYPRAPSLHRFVRRFAWAGSLEGDTPTHTRRPNPRVGAGRRLPPACMAPTPRRKPAGRGNKNSTSHARSPSLEGGASVDEAVGNVTPARGGAPAATTVTDSTEQQQVTPKPAAPVKQGLTDCSLTVDRCTLLVHTRRSLPLPCHSFHVQLSRTVCSEVYRFTSRNNSRVRPRSGQGCDCSPIVFLRFSRATGPGPLVPFSRFRGNGDGADECWRRCSPIPVYPYTQEVQRCTTSNQSGNEWPCQGGGCGECIRVHRCTVSKQRKETSEKKQTNEPEWPGQGGGTRMR